MALWQGVPTERPTIGEIEALPGVEQPLARRRRAARGERRAGRRASRTSTAAALEMTAPGPMQVARRARRRDARARPRPIALPPLVQGVEPLSPASDAGLQRGRPDPRGRRQAARLVRRRCARWCSPRAAGPSRSTVWRDGATLDARDHPEGARHRGRRGRLRAAGDDRRRRRAALPAGDGDAGAVDGASRYGVERTWCGHRPVAERHPQHPDRRHRRGEPAGAARHRADLGRDRGAGPRQLHRADRGSSRRRSGSSTSSRSRSSTAATSSPS